VVGEITREDIDAAADSFDRDLVLWDNFPVNDFDRSRIFVGPLVGRTRDVAGSRLVGFAPNPMPEAAASLFSLRAAAEWGRDPGSYDPEAARRRSWQEIAADGLTGLEPLLNACSSWPPGDPADPVLEEWVEAALAGDQDAIARTRGRFSELADTESGEAPDDVRRRRRSRGGPGARPRSRGGRASRGAHPAPGRGFGRRERRTKPVRRTRPDAGRPIGSGLPDTGARYL
jgi:hypothetical protein